MWEFISFVLFGWAMFVFGACFGNWRAADNGYLFKDGVRYRVVKDGGLGA
jgi:hypothetical protein